MLALASGAATAHTTTTSEWSPTEHRMVEVKHWTLFAPHRPQAQTPYRHHWWNLFHRH
jgi:hypothetical protein